MRKSTKKDSSVQQEKAVKKQLTPFEKKKRRRKIVNTIMGVIVFFGLLCCLSGVSVVALVLEKCDVVLDTNDLAATDSTLIYDDQGELIYTVGNETRISVGYDQMPQVVIDAFVSIEDSRFFEHNGFDVPRFAKALIENIKTLSFAQGGSTITMQVIKNTYFAVDTIAEKSITRKIQEIYYSLKINELVSKEKIIEIYINRVNYGSSARGIQVAAQYYFGKDTTDLTLVEAAMLAGIVNAPNQYNPYYHLEACQERTATVLYQMYSHGYITEEEYKVALEVKIENLLVGSTTTTYGTGETVDYLAYVDVVLAELEDTYGIDPYTTPVRIYTAMNKTVQEYCDELARGNVVEFKDEYVNTSVVLIQNGTGRIVGLCGGRDYDSALSFSYAYDNRINPGSVSKAVFTYPLAFEYAGVGTNTYIEDGPTTWTGSTTLVKEQHGYYGWASLQRAFTTSYNVVSLKLYRMVEDAVGTDYMISYLKSIGVDSDVADSLNEQYAIGAQNFLVSPVQMAGMESVILSGGIYYSPHTIVRIEYINSDEEPIVADESGVQVLSEAAAWLTSYLEQVAVNGNATASDWQANGRLRVIKHSDYLVYGKTGTTLYDKTVRAAYGYPSNATKDWCMVGGTSDFTFSFWMGYDTGQYIDKTTYIDSATVSSRVDGKIVNGLLDAAEEAYGTPSNENPAPSTVTTITHLKGVTPFTEAPSYASSSYIVTSYVKTDFAELQAYESTATISSLNSFNATYETTSNRFIVNWATYPDSSQLSAAGSRYSVTYGGSTYSNLVRVYDQTWIDGVVQYYVTITNNSTGESNTYSSSSDSAAYSITNNSYSDVTYTVTGWYQYTKSGLRSNTISVSVTVPGKTIEIPDTPTEDTDTEDTNHNAAGNHDGGAEG